MVYKEDTVEPISRKGSVETLNYKGLPHSFQGPSFIGRRLVSYTKNGNPSERDTIKYEDPS